jgi:hypothetical protein
MHTIAVSIQLTTPPLCRKPVAWRELTNHQERCPFARIKCVNRGCKEDIERGIANLHVCLHQEVNSRRD